MDDYGELIAVLACEPAMSSRATPGRDAQGRRDRAIAVE
jgi:hypothetical protein